MSENDFANQMIPYSFFQSIIDMLPIAIDIINEEQASVLSNAKFREMFSWEKQNPFSKEVAQVFQSITPINSYNYEVPTMTGVKSIHLSIEPIIDQSEIIGAVVIAMDITNIITFQQQIQLQADTINSLNEQLQQLNEQRQSQLALDIDAEDISDTDITDDIKDNVDYTSRDNDTWIAIRELRNQIKRNIPTYLYGDEGVGKRNIIDQIVKKLFKRAVKWYHIEDSNQLNDLINDMENQHIFAGIYINDAEITAKLLEELTKVTNNNVNRKRWIIVSSKPLDYPVNSKNDQANNPMNKYGNNHQDNSSAEVDSFIKKLNIIKLSSLKDRKSDVLLLVDKLLPDGIKLSDNVKRKFIQYDWPKNIRQLRSVLRYADTMRYHDEQTIQVEHLPEYFHATLNNSNILNDCSDKTDNNSNINVDVYNSNNNNAASSNAASSNAANNNEVDKDVNALDILLKSMHQSDESMPEIFDKIEKSYIEQVLQHQQYNITHTASKLGIKRQALQYKLKKYNLLVDYISDEGTDTY